MSPAAPAYATDPAWAEMFQWQHDFIAEVYGDGDFQTGADKLRKFVAGAGNEWGAPQDFQQGRVAMQIDGEWRNAFMTDFAPDVNYDTAPLPTSPGTTDRYGRAWRAARSSGSRGAPSTRPRRGCCVKYLATNTDTLVYMANTVNNVPTTNEAIDSPDLDLPEQFGVVHGGVRAPGRRPTGRRRCSARSWSSASSTSPSDWQTGDATDLQEGLGGGDRADPGRARSGAAVRGGATTRQRRLRSSGGRDERLPLGGARRGGGT